MTPYRLYDVIIYDVIAGHENAYVNNLSQNRVRTVGRCHGVCLVMTHRLICNVIYLVAFSFIFHSSSQVF